MVVWELTTGCGGFSSRGQMQTEIWRKKDAETEVGTEVQMQKEIWKSFKDETKCFVFSSSTNMKKFGDG